MNHRVGIKLDWFSQSNKDKKVKRLRVQKELVKQQFIIDTFLCLLSCEISTQHFNRHVVLFHEIKTILLIFVSSP